MDEIISSYALSAVLAGSVLLIILAVVCLKIKEISPNLKKVLFSSIIGVTVLTTAFLAISTIYLNVTSSSKGPVHWHADFEIWNCGKEVNLKDPTGWSNKIGTATLHEHNDKRIHQEGVVYNKEDASLGNFFKVIGGSITSKLLVVPTNQGKLNLVSGQECDGQKAELQTFVYTVSGKTYSQKKIAHPQSYVISPQSQVPPGDCIIIEFDVPKVKTDKLCRSYKVAKQIGKLGEEIP